MLRQLILSLRTSYFCLELTNWAIKLNKRSLRKNHTWRRLWKLLNGVLARKISRISYNSRTKFHIASIQAIIQSLARTSVPGFFALEYFKLLSFKSASSSFIVMVSPGIARRWKSGASNLASSCPKSNRQILLKAGRSSKAIWYISVSNGMLY